MDDNTISKLKSNLQNKEIILFFRMFCYSVSSAEEQLRKYGLFLDEHDKKLARILGKDPDYSKKTPIWREPLIQLDYAAHEEKFLLVKLLESDRMVNKVLLTFGHLCAEIDDISKEAKQMQLKFLFKDEELLIIMQNNFSEDAETETPKHGNNNNNNNNNNIILKMSESMEYLCQMQFLLQRCILLGNNLLHQCGAVLAHDKIAPGVELKVKVGIISNCKLKNETNLKKLLKN